MISFDPPRRWARYRADDGSVCDMYHYEDDYETFMRSRDGAIMRRTALTAGSYLRLAEAQAELDRLEAER